MTPEQKAIVLSFLVGIFTHRIQNKLGERFIDPILDKITDNIESFPRIAHYLAQHGGKSFACELCDRPKNVDTLS